MSARKAQAQRRGVAVVVAAHELPPGRLLTRRDLRVAQWPAGLRPAGARADPVALVGGRLAGGVAGGEPITAARLLGRGLTTGLAADLVAVPVTVTGPRLSELVRAGDHVDLLAVPRSADDPLISSGSSGTSSAGPTTVIAARLLVLSVLRGTEPGTTDLVVAADRATGLRLTRAEVTQMLAAMVVPP